MGLESPMFDYLEQISRGGGSSSTTSGTSSATKQKASSVPKPQIDAREAQAINDADKAFRQCFGGTIGVVSREKNPKSLAGVTLSNSDIEVIKSYMQIIDDVCVNAEHVRDMKTDIAVEMFKYCKAVHARCLNLIEAKSGYGVKHQLDVLLSLSEDLDMRVKFFQNTFIGLMVKERIGGSILPEKKPSETPSKADDSKPKAPPDKNEEVKANPKPKVSIKPLPPPPSNPFFQFETKQEPLMDLLDGIVEPSAPQAPPVPAQSNEEVKIRSDAAIAAAAASAPANSLLNLNLNFDLPSSQPAVPPPIPSAISVAEVKKTKSVEEDDDFFNDLANRKS